MQLNKVQIQQLYSGIFLRKRMVKLDEQLTYIFQLDVQDLNIINFLMDFKGSENIGIKGSGTQTTIVQKTVEPRSTTPTLIAQVELNPGWKLKTVFKFSRKPIPKQKQISYIKADLDTIQTEKTLIDTIFKKVQVTLNSLQDLNAMMEQSKVQFVDLDFPPQDYSILGDADKSLIDDTVNHWRRPSQIFQKKPYHLIQRISHKNLVMGKLLDHAFYSVVCTLALLHPQLINKLFFNQKTINPHGLYRLCLCKNGEWQTVNIDDYIPCEPFSRPKFASSAIDEIWLPLLQKAYAKVHGKYLALHQLQVSNVLNDLTGCPTLIIKLNKQDALETIIKYFKAKHIVVFYDIQQKQFDEDSFTPLKHYAYPMVDVQNQNKKNYFKFVTHKQQTEQLSQDDLTKKFQYACVCKVQNWQQLRIKGKFTTVDITESPENKNQIIMSKWYYSLELLQQSQIHVCIHQEDLLIRNNSQYKKYKYLSVVLFQKGQKSKLIPMPFKKYAHNRQFQFSITLKTGIYLLVPILNQDLSKKKPPTQFDLVFDIFRKLDLLMTRSLRYQDLSPFYMVVKEVFDQSTFEQLLKTYTKQKKRIGFLSFKAMWQKNKIYWQDPATTHYMKQDLFIMSILSKNQINVLIKNNVGTQLNNRAHCQMITRYGKQLQLSKVNKTYMKVLYYESKGKIVEYMVENKYDRKIIVNFDCTESSEYRFMPYSGKLRYELDSGEKRFIMKLIPKQRNDSKNLVRKETITVTTD